MSRKSKKEFMVSAPGNAGLKEVPAANELQSSAAGIGSQAGPPKNGLADGGGPDRPELIADLKGKLPLLEGQYGNGGRMVLHARFFDPDNGTAWYVAESDGGVLFGIVERKVRDLGYFGLPGITTDPKPGIRVERDWDWKPTEIEKLLPERFRNGVLMHPHTDGRGP